MLEFERVSLTSSGKRRLKTDKALLRAVKKHADHLYDEGDLLFAGSSSGYRSEPEQEIADYFTEFEQGLLSKLSIGDQMRSYQSINLKDESDAEGPVRPYGIIISDESDGLFSGPKVNSRLPETFTSRLVMSGAAALELYRKYPDVVVGTNGKSTLNKLRFAGAAVVNRLQQKDLERAGVMFDMAQPSFTLEREKECLDVFVGADFCGDFRIGLHGRSRGHPVDETGERLDFYPSANRARYLKAYHSVEPQLMKGILLYVLSLPDTEAKQGLISTMVREAYARVKQGQQQFGNFGDAGMADGVHESLELAIAIKNNQLSASSRHLATPSATSHLRLDSVPGGMAITQVSSGVEDGGGVSLTLTNNELPLLTTALIDQAMRGAGRTGVHAHLRILDTAQNLAHGLSFEQIFPRFKDF